MKTKTCKCGALKVMFVDKQRVEIQGGWLYGSPHTHAVCFECQGRIRIAYTISYLDKTGRPIKSNKGVQHGKPARRKARKKDKGKSTGDVWRFVD